MLNAFCFDAGVATFNSKPIRHNNAKSVFADSTLGFQSAKTEFNSLRGGAGFSGDGIGSSQSHLTLFNGNFLCSKMNHPPT